MSAADSALALPHSARSSRTAHLARSLAPSRDFATRLRHDVTRPIEFEKNYVPTVGAEVCPVELLTQHGKMVFNMWDTEGEGAALADAFYIQADCAIIMFDVTNPASYESVPKWHSHLVRVCENIPIALVGNKVDREDRKVKARHINFHREHNLAYYDISLTVEKPFNFEMPLLYLARKLTRIPDLIFTGAPA